jgi:hypothetical protein
MHRQFISQNSNLYIDISSFLVLVERSRKTRVSLHYVYVPPKNMDIFGQLAGHCVYDERSSFPPQSSGALRWDL